MKARDTTPAGNNSSQGVFSENKTVTGVCFRLSPPGLVTYQNSAPVAIIQRAMEAQVARSAPHTRRGGGMLESMGITAH